MAITRRIYVSMPADSWLIPTQNELKSGVVERIEQLGYVQEIFSDPTGRKSLSGPLTWRSDAADETARHCHGAILIALPQWRLGAADGAVLLPTEYCHHEGAIARTLGLPYQPGADRGNGSQVCGQPLSVTPHCPTNCSSGRLTAAELWPLGFIQPEEWHVRVKVTTYTDLK